MRIVRAADQTFVPAGHEEPGNPGVWKRVLAERDELIVGRVQMINWARIPAGSSFRAHYHEDMEEVFIILNGQVEMRVNDASTTLGAGDMIIVAPREVHQMTNPTSQEIDYLVVGISTGQNGRTVLA